MDYPQTKITLTKKEETNGACPKCSRTQYQPFFCYHCQVEKVADSIKETVAGVKDNFDW